MALQLHTIWHSFANKYLGPCCVSMVTNTWYMKWWYHETISRVKQWPHNLHEHMFVWDWVWGIQHWQKSLSLALSQSLCGVHSSIISNTLEYTTDKSGQKSLTFKRSTIASPETSTHYSCCHSYATVVPSQAYSPHSGKTTCQREG